MNIIKRNIPNFITCLNIASGTLAILMAGYADALICGLYAWQWAMISIAMAAVADFLDGFAARSLHAYSNLGKELDSLCDVVSFGVAPAVLLYNCLITSHPECWWAWMVVLLPVAGALRLAKFNIDTRQTTSFIGLPIPANAIFWIGYVAFCYSQNGNGTQWFVSVPAILLFSWLMVSPLRLFSLKFKTYGLKGNFWRWLLILTSIVCVACMGVPGLMWLIVAYVLYGIFDGVKGS